MSTSALHLQLLLSSISSSGDLKRKVPAVLATTLGFHGAEAELNSVVALHRLTTRVFDDFENLELDENTKKTLSHHLTPFRPLIEFAHYNLDIANAQNNFLKPANLVGLVNIHAALSGKVERIELREDVSGLINLADELIDKLDSNSIPEDFAYTLKVRILQVKSALEAFQYLGAEHLSSKIEELVGALVMRSDKSVEAENKTLMQKARKFAFGSKKALEAAAASSRSAITVHENTGILTEIAKSYLENGGGQ
jgi:hypothetical protein